ncbi:WD-40 repeat-containing protein [Collybia nuda]|uniref:methylated diphthine methylhydrolase n=1 Tax=Collybia nuda TaxID=64659 RepID=A0A9P5XSF0_9AGAR|nr:WD-40 repeat-containing protein [Collybia nuda]
MSSFDTVFPADTIEFCPHPDALDIFVCGTYRLDNILHPPALGPENSLVQDVDSSVLQQRRGQCLLFQLDKASDQGFHHIQTLNFPAIPDIKWCHRSQVASPLLGVADSEGGITLLEWQKNERTLKWADHVRCASTEILCLSLDWSNRRIPGTDPGNLIVSLSNGSLCLLRPGDGGGLTLTESWKAHDYELWVGAWNYWDTNVVYSGGDDSKMKGWDVRQNLQRSPIINKRCSNLQLLIFFFIGLYLFRFDAGITSIQSHPHVEHIIAVGSYDDTVRLFDMRKPLTALAEVNVGGGAWRVKWHPSPSRRDDLLVACMYDGFKVIHFDAGKVKKGGEVVRRCDLHKSLAYGVDWSFGPATHDNETIIGSCSFYDHTLYIWSG